MKTTRLKDIAEKVNVSNTTVSRVLNNLPIRVSKEKRKAILDLAKAIGYRPNLIARELQSGKTKCIGIIVPDMSTLFYPELIRLIENRLSVHGYRTIICDTRDDLLEEEEYVEDLLARCVHGLIVAPASGDRNITMFENLAKSNFPIILMDRYFPGRKLNYVVTDNKLASRKGVRIIVKKKPSHLFYLGEKKRNSTIDERLAGVKEEASIRTIPLEILLCETTPGGIRKVGEKIFSRKKTAPAIFLESNRFLMELLNIAYKKGLFMPEDFDIIGFDVFRPEISTPLDLNSMKVLKGAFRVIKQPASEMAELVAEYILSPERKRKWCIKLKAHVTNNAGSIS